MSDAGSAPRSGRRRGGSRRRGCRRCCSRLGGQGEGTVLRFVGLEGGDQTVDLGVGTGSSPARLGGVEGGAQVAQHAVRSLLGLDLVELGLTLLCRVLGDRGRRGRLCLYFVEQSHSPILSWRRIPNPISIPASASAR